MFTMIESINVWPKTSLELPRIEIKTSNWKSIHINPNDPTRNLCVSICSVCKAQFSSGRPLKMVYGIAMHKWLTVVKLWDVRSYLTHPNNKHSPVRQYRVLFAHGRKMWEDVFWACPSVTMIRVWSYRFELTGIVGNADHPRINRFDYKP